jgi:hypothetical protein
VIFKTWQNFGVLQLAKQAWRFLTRPKSLCSQMLKAIYFPSNDILSAQIGNNPSKTWRASCDGIDVLRQGLIKHIRDGENT